jgi:hypothetical protein
MAREPKPIGPARGFAGPGADLGDPPPVEPYPIKRGGRAVPDRTRTPDIGPACGDTRHVVEGDVASPAPRLTDELRSGIDMGTTRGNNEVPKTTQEHGDSVREARGVRTRPSRPGRAWTS